MPLSINAIITMIAIAAPLMTYGVMEVKQRLAVNAAVRAERAAGVMACNSRVGEIERSHNAAVARSAADARAAAEAIGRTPETMAELKALCQRSASCRDRGIK